MATAPMRHFNSPEERAKREGPTAEPTRGAGFRHYNSPEEVAKRSGQGKPSSAIAPKVKQQRAQPAPALLDWPPPGQDNTASVQVQSVPTPPPPPRGPRFLGDVSAAEVRECTTLVSMMVSDVQEAREFRVLMNNLAAVVASQRTFGERLRVLEEELLDLKALLKPSDDDDDDGTPPVAPVAPPALPPSESST